MKPPLRNLPSANVANGGLIRIIHRWSIRGGKDALGRFGTLDTLDIICIQKKQKHMIMVLKRVTHKDVICFSKNFSVKGSLKKNSFIPFYSPYSLFHNKKFLYESMHHHKKIIQLSVKKK